MGLPITPAQMRHLFVEFSDGCTSGHLPVSKLANHLLAGNAAAGGHKPVTPPSLSSRSTRPPPLTGPFTPHATHPHKMMPQKMMPPHLLNMHSQTRTPPDDSRTRHGLEWQNTQQLGRRRAHSTTPGMPYTPHTDYEYNARVHSKRDNRALTARSGFSLAKLRY